MAKTKADWLKEAKDLGIKVESTAKIADIKVLIESSQDKAPKKTEAAQDTATDEKPVLEAADAPQEAKAGKRSHKALEEAAAKAAKADRKTSDEIAPAKSKASVKPSRSRLERRSKGFRKSAELLKADKSYNLDEAAELAKQTSHVKFDATVELHVNLGVDPRQADQNIRDNVVLPAGTGKTVRVAVADDELLAKLDKGVIDFDVLVANPAFMPKLGKYARILGPKGLMPNPKSGTVTTDTDKAVAEAQAGRVEYRVDSTGIVHLGVGKVSFTAAQLTQNIQAVLTSIKSNKPSSIKGNYLKTAHLTTTMGPAIPLDVNTLG